MKGFDSIGSSVVDCENFATFLAKLNLPVVVGSHFDNAFSRADVESINIFPTLNLSLRDCLTDTKNIIERQLRINTIGFDRGRLYPRKLFFNLKQ